MKNIYIIVFLFFFTNTKGQEYTTQNAHSHNDYEQSSPFELAYNEKFGSIEADIHLSNGMILVGHDSKDLKNDRTLENLFYLYIHDVG
jgi:alkaline phosphatase